MNNNNNNFRAGFPQPQIYGGYPSAPKKSGGIIGALLELFDESPSPSYPPITINPAPPVPRPVQQAQPQPKPVKETPKPQPKPVKAQKQPEQEKTAAQGLPLPPNGIKDAVVWSEIIGTPRYKVTRQKRQEREKLAMERLKAAREAAAQEEADNA